MTDAKLIAGIGQIAIAVADIDQATAFYRDVLGLEFLFHAPPGQAPTLAFFNCGDIRLMLTTPQGEASDHRTSVIYYKVESLNATVRALKDKGVVFEQEPQKVADMPDHQLWMGFLRDPDANLIGIMAELPLEA